MVFRDIRTSLKCLWNFKGHVNVLCSNVINTLPYLTASLSQSQTFFLNTKHHNELTSATHYCPLLIRFFRALPHLKKKLKSTVLAEACQWSQWTYQFYNLQITTLSIKLKQQLQISSLSWLWKHFCLIKVQNSVSSTFPEFLKIVWIPV